ncbi:hypothetical protein PAHAL_6G041200 [Panicum hallii]|uniref:Uncharacterized protein n=1 Tax=Panicum hallii TaxID=206008 RepID=A0A2T8IF37_9POAL|nr:hypothetical protein PAHAL_6G041200 [Panicum hallii]
MPYGSIQLCSSEKIMQKLRRQDTLIKAESVS